MFNKIAINSSITEGLNAPLDPRLIKIKPGKNGANYISGSAVIDLLNLNFGHLGWSWSIDKTWVEESVDKVTTFVWENNQKRNLTPDEYIIEPQLPVCHTIGTLSVFFTDEAGISHTVCKTAPGAQPIMAGQSNQENCYKGAHTDALKKAATLFGIGLEMYRRDNDPNWFAEVSYVNPWNEESLLSYKEQWDTINNFIKDTGNTMEGFMQMLADYAGASVEIVPENIEDISLMIINAGKPAEIEQ